MSMRIIMGKDGTTDGRDRIRTLAENTLFFRTALVDLGFIVYGTNLFFINGLNIYTLLALYIILTLQATTLLRSFL
jgi:hypothetical protein